MSASHPFNPESCEPAGEDGMQLRLECGCYVQAGKEDDAAVFSLHECCEEHREFLDRWFDDVLVHVRTPAVGLVVFLDRPADPRNN